MLYCVRNVLEIRSVHSGIYWIFISLLLYEPCTVAVVIPSLSLILHYSGCYYFLPLQSWWRMKREKKRYSGRLSYMHENEEAIIKVIIVELQF